MSLLAADMVIKTDNPKESTKSLLELISEFIKAAGYKVDI